MFHTVMKLLSLTLSLFIVEMTVNITYEFSVTYHSIFYTWLQVTVNAGTGRYYWLDNTSPLVNISLCIHCHQYYYTFYGFLSVEVSFWTTRYHRTYNDSWYNLQVRFFWVTDKLTWWFRYPIVSKFSGAFKPSAISRSPSESPSSMTFCLCFIVSKYSAFWSAWLFLLYIWMFSPFQPINTP